MEKVYFRRETTNRISGAIEIGLFSLFGVSTTAVAFILPEMPLAYRILNGGLSLAMYVGILDGGLDLIKGTHHFLGMQAYKHLTNSQEMKRLIDLNIRYDREHKDQEVNLFFRFR